MADETSFESLLETILNDYRNQFLNQSPGVYTEVDLSQGSLAFIKSVVLASAIWGIHKHADYCINQIFPDTAIPLGLEHHAYTRGLTRLSGESDSQLLDRLLTLMRRPPAGGNRFDYETWAKTVSIDGPILHNPSSGMISNTGMGGFVAANCVDSSTASKAWDTDASAAGSTITIDHGISNDKAMVRVRLYAGGHSTANYTVQYSDDGVSWSNAASNFVLSDGAWNTSEWASVGAHRFWRLYLSNTPGSGPDVFGMEWYCSSESVRDAFCFSAARGPGTVDVLVISSVGYGTPSHALLQAVSEYLDSVRPVTSNQVSVVAPDIVLENVSISVAGSIDSSDLESDIISLFSNLLPGASLYHSRLVAMAIANGALNAVVSDPASDVTCTPYQMLRCGGVSIT